MNGTMMLWGHAADKTAEGEERPHTEKVMRAAEYFFKKYKKKPNHIIVGEDVPDDTLKELQAPKGLLVERLIRCPKGHYMLGVSTPNHRRKRDKTKAN